MRKAFGLCKARFDREAKKNNLMNRKSICIKRIELDKAVYAYDCKTKKNMLLDMPLMI